MGLFSNNNKKAQKVINKWENQLTKEKKSQGGSCKTCQHYSSYRGVCTLGSGHITSPNSICPYWKI